jgi:hypothetical protein
VDSIWQEMSNEEKCNIINACFANVCENYNIPASLILTSSLFDKYFSNFQLFLEIHTCGCVDFSEIEVWKQFSKTGIKSKKDYRKLRSFVRIKLISAIYDIRNLTEESLRNLGVKEFSGTMARSS